METPWVETTAWTLSCLLDLPMRDGNDIMAYQNASGSSAFRPSYEGWKLGTEDRDLSRNRSFRPSLRDGNVSGIALSTVFGMLLDLPMRDGNFAIHTEIIDALMLLDLPMRDGNCSGTYRSKGSTKLLDLPMRDGNHLRPWDHKCN